MSLHGDYTSRDVPQEILNKVTLDGLINVDVLSMGAMAGSGLSDEAAEDKGLIKNHWMWRFLVQGPGALTGQIQFGFNLKETPSVPSDQAQYARSSDRSFDSSSGGAGAVSTRSLASDDSAKFDDVSSINKPPALSSSGEHVISDAPSVIGVPSIRSSLGGFIQQPSEGPRVPGTFDITVRPRTDPSWSHRFTRSFHLAPGTTFGQLFHSVTSRGMEPFHFRQVEFARFGCRDGMYIFYCLLHNFLLIICFRFSYRAVLSLLPRGSRMASWWTVSAWRGPPPTSTTCCVGATPSLWSPVDSLLPTKKKRRVRRRSWALAPPEVPLTGLSGPRDMCTSSTPSSFSTSPPTPRWPTRRLPIVPTSPCCCL